MKTRALAVLVLVFILMPILATGCQSGPKAEVKVRVLVTHLFPETTSIRGLSYDGKEYDVFFTAETIIDSGQEKAFTYADIILGDELDLWLNKIPRNPEPDPPHYNAVQVKIAPTTR